MWVGRWDFPKPTSFLFTYILINTAFTKKAACTSLYLCCLLLFREHLGEKWRNPSSSWWNLPRANNRLLIRCLCCPSDSYWGSLLNHLSIFHLLLVKVLTVQSAKTGRSPALFVLFSLPRSCSPVERRQWSAHLCQFPRVATSKQNFIISQFWKLTVRNQGSTKAMLPLKPERKILPCLSLARGGLPAIFDVPWLVDASLQTSVFTSFSLCLYIVFLLCLSVSKCPHIGLVSTLTIWS